MIPKILIQSVGSGLFTYTHNGMIGDRLSREEMLAELAAILFDAPSGPRYLRTPEAVRRDRESHPDNDGDCPSPLYREAEHDLWCIVREVGMGEPHQFYCWHPSRESADREAEALAKNNDGTFCVLRVQGKCRGTKPAVEWLTPVDEMPF